MGDFVEDCEFDLESPSFQSLPDELVTLAVNMWQQHKVGSAALNFLQFLNVIL